MADDWREAGAPAPAEHLTRREPSSDAAEQLHMPCAADECEVVSPSDVLVHGRGSIEEVLEVLCDVRSVQQAQGRGAIARKFDSPNEFEELVKRVRDGRATVVLRKLFLYRGMRRDPAQCSVMQEIWIEDKNNPDAVSNPFKSYAVVHVHHHCERRVDRIEDIKPEHLAIVDSINARHICDSGGKHHLGDNPFFDTYIEPSGGDTLKVFPDGEWPCSKCGQKNLQKRASCRGWRGASCAGIRPCKAWKWGAEAGSNAGLAQILKAADETLQWPSRAGKSMHREAGASCEKVHADRLDSLLDAYLARAPRRDLANVVLRDAAQPSCHECKLPTCPADCSSWRNLDAAVLCIGLGEYKNISRLPNAAGDARELYRQANAVQGCRAELMEGLQDVFALIRGIRKFLKRNGLQQHPPKAVLIVCCGHGMQNDGKVYLIPEDASHPDDEFGAGPDKEYLALSEILNLCKVDLDDHARRLKPVRAPFFLLIFDACRVRQSDFQNSVSSRCNNDSKLGTPADYSLCFSCSRGSVAMDGRPGEHSPFAQALLDPETGIFVKGMPLKTALEEACRRLGNCAGVSGQKPVSVCFEEINAGLCLFPARSEPGADATAGIPAPSTPSSSPCDDELKKFFERLDLSHLLEDVRSHLRVESLRNLQSAYKRGDLESTPNLPNWAKNDLVDAVAQLLSLRSDQSLVSESLSQASTPLKQSPRDREVVGIHHEGDPQHLREHVGCLFEHFAKYYREVEYDVQDQFYHFSYLELDIAHEFSGHWTFCMLIWSAFVGSAKVSRVIQDDWLFTLKSFPEQQELLSIVDGYVRNGSIHDHSQLDAIKDKVAQYNRPEEQHVAAIAVIDIIVQQHLTGDDKTKWQTDVVNGWYESRDAGPENFLLRANRYLRETIGSIQILQTAFETGSYVMYMTMSPLAAVLLFEHLELAKSGCMSARKPEPAAAAAGDSESLLHGFRIFVSSSGRVFSLDDVADMPASSAMHVIIQGLRCLAHLGAEEWQMLGPVQTCHMFMREEANKMLKSLFKKQIGAVQKYVRDFDGRYEDSAFGRYEDSASGEKLPIDQMTISVGASLSDADENMRQGQSNRPQEAVGMDADGGLQSQMMKEAEARARNNAEGEEERRILRGRMGYGVGEDASTSADAKHGSSQRIGNAQELLNMVVKGRFICLIGPPASGKTVTMLQVACAACTVMQRYADKDSEESVAPPHVPIFMRAAQLSSLVPQDSKQIKSLEALIRLYIDTQYPLGLKWLPAGSTEPATGRNLEHAKLAEALRSKTEFTKQEWEAFGIKDLCTDHFIKSGDLFFQPAGIASLLVQFLELRRVLVIIDGIDEAAGHRRMIEKLIDDAAEAKDMCLMISTRDYAFKTSRAEKRFYKFEAWGILPLYEQGRNQLIDKRLPDSQALDFRTHLAAGAQQTQEMITSPFLLALLIEVFKKHKTIPLKRNELYDKQVDATLMRHRFFKHLVSRDTQPVKHREAVGASRSMATAEEEAEITLLTFDKHLVKVPKSIAARSVTINMMIEGAGDEVVPLVELHAKSCTLIIITRVVEYLKRHAELEASNADDEVIKQFDKEFQKQSHDAILQTFTAADYLDIEDLLISSAHAILHDVQLYQKARSSSECLDALRHIVRAADSDLEAASTPLDSFDLVSLRFFLEAVAFSCQVRLERRDFEWDAALQEEVGKLWKLSSCTDVPLEVISGFVLDLASMGLLSKVGDGKFRFSHLTMQEYLAASCAVTLYGSDSQMLIKQLCAAASGLKSPLHSSWKREVLQFTACMLQDTEQATFTDFCSAVLESDDGSGTCCELVRDFLKERGSCETVEQMLLDKMQKIRGTDLLVAGLCHSSSEMRSLVLSEIIQFCVPSDPFADGTVPKLKEIAVDADCVWHERAASVLSIAQIAQMKHCARSDRTETISWLLGMLQLGTRALENVHFAIIKALGTMLKQDASDSDAVVGIILRQEDESVLLLPDLRESDTIANALSDLQVFSEGLVDWVQREPCVIAQGRWPIRHVQFMCEKVVAGEDSARASSVAQSLLSHLHSPSFKMANWETSLTCLAMLHKSHGTNVLSHVMPFLETGKVMQRMRVLQVCAKLNFGFEGQLLNDLARCLLLGVESNNGNPSGISLLNHVLETERPKNIGVQTSLRTTSYILSFLVAVVEAAAAPGVELQQVERELRDFEISVEMEAKEKKEKEEEEQKQKQKEEEAQRLIRAEDTAATLANEKKEGASEQKKDDQFAKQPQSEETEPVNLETLMHMVQRFKPTRLVPEVGSRSLIYCSTQLWSNSGLIQELDMCEWLNNLREHERDNATMAFGALMTLQEPWFEGCGRKDGVWERKVKEVLKRKTVIGRFVFGMLLSYIRRSIERAPGSAMEDLSVLGNEIEHWNVMSIEQKIEKMFLLKELRIGRRARELPTWKGDVSAAGVDWKNEPCWEGDRVTRNWRTPNNETDFAASAGQAEKEVLRALEFSLLLDGREIGGLKWINVGTTKPSKGKELSNTSLATALKTKTVLTQQEVDDLRIFDLCMDDFIMSGDSYFKPGSPASHGLTGKGFLEKDALSVLGVCGYSDLWGLSGKVVEKASELLLSKAHSTAARDQVRKAHCELEQAVCFRQLDVMAWRFNAAGMDVKKTRETHKKHLLEKLTKEEILKKYLDDYDDRQRIREGETAKIPWEQQAEAEAVQVAITPVAEPYAADRYDMDVKYCTLLEKKGVEALEKASGATIEVVIPTRMRRNKGESKGSIFIQGPTKKQCDVAWKLIERQKELDSDCEKLGLKWINVGTTKPSDGGELVNNRLATALMTTSELTEEDFGNLGIRNLRGDDFIMSGDAYFKPVVCGKCKRCTHAHHFLQLDKVFEAKEKLHALLLCQICSDKDTAEGPGRFSDKFYCEKCWKAAVEESSPNFHR